MDINNEMHSRLETDGPNSHDQGPETSILEAQGKHFLHAGTGQLYQVQGCGWDSERDRWMIRYVQQEISKEGLARSTRTLQRTNYFHLPEDFFRTGRFLEVKA